MTEETGYSFESEARVIVEIVLDKSRWLKAWRDRTGHPRPDEAEAEPPHLGWFGRADIVEMLTADLVARLGAASGLAAGRAHTDPGARKALFREGLRVYSARLFAAIQRGDDDARVELRLFCEESLRRCTDPRSKAPLVDALERLARAANFEPDDVLHDLAQDGAREYEERILAGAVREAQSLSYQIQKQWAPHRLFGSFEWLHRRRNEPLTDSDGPQQPDADDTRSSGVADLTINLRHGTEDAALDRVVAAELLIRLVELVKTKRLSQLEVLLILLDTFEAPSDPSSSVRYSGYRATAAILVDWRSRADELADYLVSKLELSPSVVRRTLRVIHAAIVASGEVPNPPTARWVGDRTRLAFDKLAQQRDLEIWLRTLVDDEDASTRPVT